jgi:outer membrane protein
VDTSGRLRAQLSRAKADQDAAAANIVLSQRDLRRAVAASFYRLTLARKLIQVARENLTEAQGFESRNRLLVDNQEVAQADLVKASAQVAFFEQAVNASELDARLANHDLASFWTQDVEGELPVIDILESPMPAPEGTSPPASPFLGRPEFRLFDAQRRGFQADARRARAELFPQLSLVQQYGFDSTHFSFADRGYASFVHLNIPVFDWFRARSASRQFALQASQVDVNRQIAERTFSKEYRDALARVELVYAQIAITEKQVKLSEDNLRLSRVRYEGGEGVALDVVAAQGQLAQARANYFTAKANYLNARVDLEVAAGR